MKKYLLLLLGLLLLVSNGNAQKTFATAQTNAVTGLCLLCGVINPNSPINNSNLNDYSSYAITSGLLGVSLEQTLIFPEANVNIGRDSIVVGIGADNSLLTANLFNGITVETYNGALPNNDGVPGPALNIRLLKDNTRAEIVLMPGQRFDRVKIKLFSALVGSLQGLRIYYAYNNPSALIQPDANGILYVKKGGTGNGSSWSSPLGEVADALISAKDNTTVKQIWVASGSYKPLYAADNLNNRPNTSNRQNSFVLVKDVPVYGGFSGTETQLTQRDWSLNKTILSGEMQGDGSSTNNAYHVVISAGDVGSAALDGFTVSDGVALFEDPGSSKVTVNGVVLINRMAGGIYCVNSSPLIKNCLLTNNDGYASTAFRNESGSPVVVNTLMTGNTNRYYYNIVFNSEGGSPSLINVSIVNNSCTYPVLMNGGVLYNSIIWGNNILSNNPPQITIPIQNCIVQKGAFGSVDIGTDPLFTNTANGDFTLQKASPAINKGNNSLFPALSADTKDLTGKSRVYDFNNGGVIDIGAYEYQGSTLSEGLDCDASISQSNSANGLCVGCSVSNAGAAVDQSPSTASTLNVAVYIPGANVRQNLIFPSTSAIGDTVTVVMKVQGGLLATDALGAIQIGSFNGAISNNDYTTLSASLSNLKVVVSGSSLRVKFAPAAQFDRITVVLNSGIIPGLSTLEIYYATRKVSPPLVDATKINAFNDEQVTLKTTAPSNVTVTWYNTATGGNPLPASPTLGTVLIIPPINASTIYYAQATRTSNGCVNPERVPVTVTTSPRPSAVLTTSSGNTAFVAGDNITSTPVVVDTGIDLSSQAIATLSSATIAITTGFRAGEDILAFNPSAVAFGDITGSYNSPTGILTLASSGAATIQQWKAALGQIMYTNTAITPETNDRVVSFTVNDGTKDSNTATKTITVSATDQTPIVTASSGNTVYTLGQNVVVDAGITVSDLDNTALASASVSITKGFQAGQDILSLTNDGMSIGNIAGSYNSSTGVLTLTSSGATATLAQWQSALSSIGYFNSATDQRTGDRIISFIVNDGTNSSAATSKILVQKALLSQTITADAVSKVYGASDFEPGATASSSLQVSYASNDKNIADAYLDLADSKWKIKIKKAGSVSITVSQPGNGTYSPAADVSMNLTIAPAPLTITATDGSKIYDKVVYQGGNGVTFSNFVLGETKAVLSGTLTYAGTSQGAADVGSYTLVPSGLTSPNYSITFVSGTLTISKAALTITAEAKNKTYGELDPVFTYTSAGLVNGDIIQGTLSRSSGEGIGSYAILQGTLSASGNYELSYTGANLTIGKKTIAVIAEAKTKVYGESDPVLTYTFSPELIEGDRFTGSLKRAAGENAGVYVIDRNDLTLNSNYDLAYTSADLTISTAALTITAVAKGKTYGDTDPLLSYTSIGLVNGDLLQGTLSRLPGEGTGNYAILQGTLSASANYELSYTGANLTIGKKTIAVIADAKSKVYGESDPVLTYTFSPALIGADHFTGSLKRVAGENTGVYVIGRNDLALNANYDLTYTSADFTIKKKTVSVIADAKSKTYGDEDPVLTYTFSPALSGSDQISGAMGRTPGENVNTYLISQNTLSAGSNYTLNYQNAVLTITKAVLTATAGNQMMCQGNNLPDFNILYAGFKNGDGENVMTEKPKVGTSAKRSSPPGNYVLTPTGGTASNYTFTYVNGDLKINSLPIVRITSDKGNNVSKGETLVLTATGGTTYAWTGANIISSRNGAVLTIRPTENETYTVTATNSSGCSQSYSYSITIRDDFQAVSASNILSPNGDGINDLWVVKNIDMYPNNEVKIFDKAGRLIYSKRGYDNTWDGTFNGNALAENTYYYIIDFGTGKLKQKGYITLIRQQ